MESSSDFNANVGDVDTIAKRILEISNELKASDDDESGETPIFIHQFSEQACYHILGILSEKKKKNEKHEKIWSSYYKLGVS